MDRKATQVGGGARMRDRQIDSLAARPALGANMPKLSVERAEAHALAGEAVPDKYDASTIACTD